MPGFTTAVVLAQVCAWERQQAQSASMEAASIRILFIFSDCYLRPYSGLTLRRARMVTTTVATQQTITIQKKFT